MADRLWRACLGGTTILIAGYLLVPQGSWLQTGWAVTVGYVATGAIGYGIRRNTPPGRALWWCFAAGIFGNTSGIAIEAVNSRILENDSVPSVADVGYLSLYPALALGLALLIRRRNEGRDWTALVDATTVTTGLALLAWVFMIRPTASAGSIGLLGHITNAAYPIADVVLVAMTVRLLRGSGQRGPAYWLMTASLLAFLGGDTAWAIVNQADWVPGPVAGRLLSMFFLVAYALFGAAALHPSVRELSRPAGPGSPRLSGTLLASLTLASLTAPAVLAIQVAQGRVTDGIAIVLGSVSLFLLVVTRMAQLLRQLERQTQKVRELSQTDELTGLPNRRAWNAELPRAIERARRDHVPLAVAVLDMDHFKRFNDAYGHPAGDRLLKAAAASWQEQLRSVDHLARFGGEEFILLLPDADAAQADDVVSRLRLATPLGQTVSAGLAVWDVAETSDELVARADAALYQAKRAGRDRVVLAAPTAVIAW